MVVAELGLVPSFVLKGDNELIKVQALKNPSNANANANASWNISATNDQPNDLVLIRDFRAPRIISVRSYRFWPCTSKASSELRIGWLENIKVGR